MKNAYYLILFAVNIILLASCNNAVDSGKSNKKTAELSETTSSNPEVSLNLENNKQLADYLPKNYVMFDTIYGDLNKDGLEDCVLIIKGTDKTKVIQHEYRGELDRNRRGILILLKQKKNYTLAVQNLNCFSSENEEGGVYYAPELWFEIKKGNLYINYSHGRYGFWNYTFRLKDSDFELIGYDDSENHGPMVLYTTSINYLSKKKQEKENIDPHSFEDGGTEVFKETWSKIKSKKMTLLSEIKDFDELELEE
jgi:hypothetical protein